MKRSDIQGVMNAQRLTRSIVQEVGASIAPGDTEIEVVRRMETAFERAGVEKWLHTPYAWWGERARFDGFKDWEPDALPTERRLQEGESFIIDAAPVVDGYPGDYALSGQHGGSDDAHQTMLSELAALKAQMVEWAKSAATGKALFERVGDAMNEAGMEVVHDQYPASVLGHSFGLIPKWLTRTPQIGRGFQLPLVGGYAMSLFKHRVLGGAYPFINDVSDDRPLGLYAVEPHLGQGAKGAKFESILLVDGDETRWLDPELFGEVVG